MASTRVMEMPELAEMILLNLMVEDLTRCARVCTLWKDLIHGNRRALRRLLYLNAIPDHTWIVVRTRETLIRNKDLPPLLPNLKPRLVVVDDAPRPNDYIDWRFGKRNVGTLHPLLKSICLMDYPSLTRKWSDWKPTVALEDPWRLPRWTLGQWEHMQICQPPCLKVSFSLHTKTATSEEILRASLACRTGITLGHARKYLEMVKDARPDFNWHGSRLDILLHDYIPTTHPLVEIASWEPAMVFDDITYPKRIWL